MRKQVGDYEHTFCDKCGRDITESHSRDFLFRGDYFCFDCWSKIRDVLITPYYQNHIPSFVEGGTYRIFEFTTQQELIDYFNDEINEETVLVKSPVGIMVQSLSKSFWWVLGGVANFDMNTLNIPEFNKDIYDKNKVPIKSEIDKWLSGYTR